MKQYKCASPLLNQYSPVPRAQLDCREGRYAAALAQISVHPLGVRLSNEVPPASRMRRCELIN